MTDSPTPNELAAIRERAAKATKGPWYRRQGYVYRRDDPHNAFGFRVDDCRGPCVDADFIAHARSDIPRLLDALEEKDAEIARLANPCPGDIQAQAAAWSAVWKELEAAGIYGFWCSDPRSRVRAVEFIRHLANAVKPQGENHD